MSECSQYRELLELLPSIDCPDPHFTSVLNHLKNCPDCMERYLINCRMNSHIKRSMSEKIITPPLLAEQIKNTLKDKPKSTHSYHRWVYIAVIGLFVALFLSYQQPTPSSRLKLIASQAVIQHKNKEKSLTSQKKNAEVSTTTPPSLEAGSTGDTWQKCTLGDIQADYCIFLNNEGVNASLYRITDNLSDLEQWNGEKKIFNQKNYSVAIWKRGDIIYSMVLKYPAANKEKAVASK